MKVLIKISRIGLVQNFIIPSNLITYFPALLKRDTVPMVSFFL